MKDVFSKKNRALLGELVRTDFKLRYQGSVLGYLWSLLRPLLLFSVLYVIFAVVIPLNPDVPHFPVYLLLGVVLWNLFAEMTTMSLGSIVGRGDLIRKIKIPRWIIVFSSSISALINVSLNLVIVAVFMFFNHVELMGTAVFFPLAILEIYLFALGISFFLAAAYVKFRDINYIWEVCMQIGFYATPILYVMTLINNQTLIKIMLLNPVAQAMQDARYALVSHHPNIVTINQAWNSPFAVLMPLALILVVLVVGAWYFKRESKYFAENI